MSSIRPGLSETIPGCNRIEPTLPIKEIFDQVTIEPSDVLIDIGCGDGDVIQHWLDRGLTNQLIGIELDTPTYFNTKERFRDCKNVKIIRDDASHHPPLGSLYYLFNPFTGLLMKAFEAAVPKTARIVYFNPKEIDVFSNWTVKEIWPKHPRAVLIYR